MGIRFDALSKTARLAVADHVRREFELLISLQPETYVSRNAKADPQRWQDGLRELIAGDPKRVEYIVLAAERNDVLNSAGFTLIELSIVLVIIGLIVGGVLVGQSLISAAAVRAQITQIEKLNTAVNTFYGKYGYLPGDIPAAPAGQFGFAARGLYAGEGDGNGLIEGVNSDAAASNAGTYESAGETALFWSDLATARLIDGTFPSATANVPTNYGLVFPLWFPPAKINASNTLVYVFSKSGTNYFGISAVNGMYTAYMSTFPTLTVSQAYAIDNKMDDGLPQSGRVLAAYAGQFGAGWDIDSSQGTGFITFFPALYQSQGFTPSPTSCTDNGGQAGTHLNYSIAQNNGANVNCALSFRMQAGD